MNFNAEFVKGVVELISVLIMLTGLFGVIWQRVKQDRGLSTIAVQFLAIVFVFPVIMILALEGVLKSDVSGALIGTLAGYLFAEFGKPKIRSSTQND